VVELEVVVINYNAGEDIIDCLTRLAEQISGESIVVIDNASTDGSVERIEREHPDVRMIRNERNSGFAAAANQGVRATSSPYVVLVNPDADVRPGFVQTLGRALDEHPKAGAVGALVLNPDGSVQPTKRAFPSLWHAALHGIVGIVWPDNPGTRAYTLADASFTEPRTVGWVAGTAVALRREAFEAVGGFDEVFFFFVEDVDLCRRLWDAGWEVWFEPRAVAEHAWGTSWTQRPLRFLWIHQRSLMRYVMKHRRGMWVLGYPLIALALVLRFVLLAIRWLFTRRSVPKHRRIGEARR
jgi:N-acetylglucosaminyl-diphospho-decaprenol L-rhamnosyltransferase